MLDDSWAVTLEHRRSVGTTVSLSIVASQRFGGLESLYGRN